MTLVTTGNHVGDTDSLPKWAQGYIDRLERQVDEQAKLLREQHIVDSTTVAVKPRMQIVSTVESSSYDRLTAIFRPDGSLDVSAMGMAIEPMAGNRVIIHSGTFK